MRMLPLCLLTISLPAWPLVVSADPIVIFMDGRFVSAGGTIRDNSDQILDDHQQLFGATSASGMVASPDGYQGSGLATLSSSIGDPHHLFGAGTGSVSATVPSTNRTGVSEAGSSSSFSVSFFVDRQHAFDFSGVFTGTDSPGSQEARGWEASLIRHSTNPDFTIFDHGDISASGTDQLQEHGLIPFGEYTLLVEQRLGLELHEPGSTSSMHGEFAFMFDLAQTPEPASALLLSSGLLGLLAARQRRST